MRALFLDRNKFQLSPTRCSEQVEWGFEVFCLHQLGINIIRDITLISVPRAPFHEHIDLNQYKAWVIIVKDLLA